MTERRQRYQKGRWAEYKAALFLMCRFYRVLAVRYKTRHGEIDLIVCRGATLVFVEVKARDNYTSGVEAVSLRTRERIQAAAAHFVATRPCFRNYVWRFDVAVVSPKRLPYHVKDAWRP
jgi:putative endonuclease